MEAGVLFSGGKDSALAASLLDNVCDLTLLCCTFGITDDHEHAVRTAETLDYPVRTVELDPNVARAATERIVEDGFPRNGIQQIHEHALDRCATLGFDAIADGTRRDDRVPTVERPLAQSLEDRHDISYLAPLAGFGRAAIDTFIEDTFTVETGPSGGIDKGDYETEVRELIRVEYGAEKIDAIFPEHVQSRVTGWR